MPLFLKMYKMNIVEAKDNIKECSYKDILTSDEEFLYIESLEYLVKETNDPKYMMELGGLYSFF